MKRVLVVLVAVLGGILLIFTFNALRAPTRTGVSSPGAAAAPRDADLDVDAAARHLAEAIRFKTVSITDQAHSHVDVFLELHEWLARTYPSTHAALDREVVNGESLLYTWKGSDTNLLPVAFLAHMDVVPVQERTLDAWTHPPFSGAIEDGVIWGRGALDMKSTLISIMEATEILVRRGYAPPRTVYLAFGHDEEVSGPAGAAQIAQTLESRGIRLAWTLDEGGMVIKEGLPGIGGPVAMINVAEKGYLTVELVAHGADGHSSMPPDETAVGRLARALIALESQPFPPRIDGAIGAAFDHVGAVSPFAVRLVTANRWFFDPILARLLTLRPEMAAMVRTTTAATKLEASPKENVLAAEAVGTVNFRILPGETQATVLERVRALVDDEFIEVRTKGGGSEPSRVSSTSNSSFDAITRAIDRTFPGAVVVPGLLMGGSDSRLYVNVASDSYRFAGFTLESDQVKLFHGTNERISVESLADMIQFNLNLMGHELGNDGSVAAAQ